MEFGDLDPADYYRYLQKRFTEVNLKVTRAKAHYDAATQFLEQLDGCCQKLTEEIKQLEQSSGNEKLVATKKELLSEKCRKQQYIGEQKTVKKEELTLAGQELNEIMFQIMHMEVGHLEDKETS